MWLCTKHHSKQLVLPGSLHAAPELPPLFWAARLLGTLANDPTSASANETATIREFFLTNLQYSACVRASALMADVYQGAVSSGDSERGPNVQFAGYAEKVVCLGSAKKPYQKRNEPRRSLRKHMHERARVRQTRDSNRRLLFLTPKNCFQPLFEDQPRLTRMLKTLPNGTFRPARRPNLPWYSLKPLQIRDTPNRFS